MPALPALPALRGQILRAAALADYTWFRVGGPADILFLPADEEDLAQLLKALPAETPVLALGVGSNVIIRDGGVAGVVVRLAGRPWGEVTADPETAVITAGAGALDASVARAAAKAGIAGLEFLVGVPGTIGGALTMNAGCYGREIKDILIEAHGLERATSKPIRLRSDDIGFSYRRNGLPEGAILWTKAVFQGAPDAPDAIAARMAEITAKREAAQPIREKTGGSTFKNPPGDSAWRLVDQVGLRGYRHGGAMVSDKHCNFFINAAAATAADIEALGEEVRAKVKEQTGVTLEWEIKRIGRPAS
jgi:UDP-N-acetylmuramate dehydrogenase